MLWRGLVLFGISGVHPSWTVMLWSAQLAGLQGLQSRDVWKAGRDSRPWSYHLHNEYCLSPVPCCCCCFFLRLSAVCTVLTQLLFHYLCPVDWCWPCYINEVCVDLTLHFDPQYHTWQSLLSEYFLHKNHDNTDNVIILVTVIVIWNFQRRKKCWKVNACSKIVLEGN